VEFKNLSNTGLRLPAIGIGTWKYRGSIEPLRRALQLGSCLIDSAESYGTEETIGEAIKGLRDQVIISTKVWPTHFKYKDVIKAADNSLRRLKTDYIDLYQLHWPNPTIPISETMQAMESLVDAGKIRFIGVSNFSVRQLEQAQASMTRHKIVSNQVSYSLIDRHIERYLLPFCSANAIMIIAYCPLGRGLNHIQALDKQHALRTVMEAIGKTCAQVVLNWCISKKNVVAIPKANSVGHVVENCGATGWRLSPQHIRLQENTIKSQRGPIERMLRGKAQRLLEVIGMRQPMYKIEID
jgi:diketogulonate reductase-like aldo/keto reductase